MATDIEQTPACYRADNAADFSYTPDRMTVFEEANRFRREFGIAPAAADARRVDLLLIDVQRDFCHPEGTLYVGGRGGQGAVEDNRRIAEFIYRNLARLTHIRCTLDSHYNFQIFFPWFWVDTRGEPLAPHTLITVDGRDDRVLVNIDPAGNVLKENVLPNPAMTPWVTDKGYDWLVEQCRFYNRELAAGGRYTLYLWPPHCLVGSPGHTVTGVVDEARTLHSLARMTQSWAEIKGSHNLTENYSVLRPEVLTTWDGGALAERNVRFYKTLVDADALVVGGQAASHCVKSTVQDLLEEIRNEDPSLARKVYLLTDCMSSVVVRGPDGAILADFTEAAEQTLDEAASAGMHLVRSTDPMESWPGM
ncbi:MAG: nicotinamidase [Deltaproteobacteria bacterium]|nr:nicotinamidase [Deltaproteobacteria bacterium]